MKSRKRKKATSRKHDTTTVKPLPVTDDVIGGNASATPFHTLGSTFQSELAVKLGVSREAMAAIMTLEEAKAQRKKREIFSKLDACKSRIIEALQQGDDSEEDYSWLDLSETIYLPHTTQESFAKRANDEDAKWQRKKEQSAIISSIIQHTAASTSKVSDMRDLIEWMTKFTFELTWDDIGVTNVEEREIEEAECYRSMIGAVQKAWDCARRLLQLVELMMSDDTYDVLAGKPPAHILAARRRKTTMFANIWCSPRLRAKFDQYEKMRLELKDDHKRPEKSSLDRHVTVLTSEEEPKSTPYKELECSMLREVWNSWKESACDVAFFMNETLCHKFTKKSSLKRLSRAMLILEFVVAAVEGKLIEADRTFQKLKDSQNIILKMKREAGNLQKEMGETQKLLYSARAGISKMKKQVKTVSRENEKLLSQVTEFDDRVKTLERRLEDIETFPSQADYDECKLQITQLQDEIIDLRQTAGDLKIMLEMRTEEFEEAKHQLANEKEATFALVQQIETMSFEKSRVEYQAGALRDRVVTQERSVASLTKLIVDKDRVIRSLKNETNGLKRKSSTKHVEATKHFQTPAILEKMIPQGMNVKGDSTMVQQAKLGNLKLRSYAYDDAEIDEETFDKGNPDPNDAHLHTTPDPNDAHLHTTPDPNDVHLHTMPDSNDVHLHTMPDPNDVHLHTTPVDSFDGHSDVGEEMELSIPSWNYTSTASFEKPKNSNGSVEANWSNSKSPQQHSSAQISVIPTDRKSVTPEKQVIKKQLEEANVQLQSMVKTYEEKLEKVLNEERRKSVEEEKQKEKDMQVFYHSVQDETMRIQREMQNFGNSLTNQLGFLLSGKEKEFSSTTSYTPHRQKSSLLALENVSSKGFLGVGIPDPQSAHTKLSMTGKHNSGRSFDKHLTGQNAVTNPSLLKLPHVLQIQDGSKVRNRNPSHKYGPAHIRRNSGIRTSSDHQQSSVQPPSSRESLPASDPNQMDQEPSKTRSPSIFNMDASFLNPSAGGEVMTKNQKAFKNREDASNDPMPRRRSENQQVSGTDSDQSVLDKQNVLEKQTKKQKARFGERRQSSFLNMGQDGSMELRSSTEMSAHPRIFKLSSFTHERSFEDVKMHTSSPDQPSASTEQSARPSSSSGGQHRKMRKTLEMEGKEKLILNRKKEDVPNLLGVKNSSIHQAEMFVKNISGMVGNFFNLMNNNLADAIKEEKQRMEDEIESLQMTFDLDRAKRQTKLDKTYKELQKTENELRKAQHVINNLLQKDIGKRQDWLNENGLASSYRKDGGKMIAQLNGASEVLCEYMADQRSKSELMKTQLRKVELEKQLREEEIRTKQKLIDRLRLQLADVRREETQQMFMSLKDHKYNYVEIQANKEIDPQSKQAILSLLRRSMNYPGFKLCQMAKRYRQKTELQSCINKIEIKLNKPLLSEPGSDDVQKNTMKRERFDLQSLLRRLKERSDKVDAQWKVRGREIVNNRQNLLLKLALLFHSAKSCYSNLHLIEPSIQKYEISKAGSKRNHHGTTVKNGRLHLVFTQSPLKWFDHDLPTLYPPANSAVPGGRHVVDQQGDNLDLKGADAFRGTRCAPKWFPKRSMFCPFDNSTALNSAKSLKCYESSSSHCPKMDEGCCNGSYRQYKESMLETPRFLVADIQAGLRQAKSVMKKIEPQSSIPRFVSVPKQTHHPISSMFSYISDVRDLKEKNEIHLPRLFSNNAMSSFLEPIPRKSNGKNQNVITGLNRFRKSQQQQKEGFQLDALLKLPKIDLPSTTKSSNKIQR